MQPIVRIRRGNTVRRLLLSLFVVLSCLHSHPTGAQQRSALSASRLASSSDAPLPVSELLPALTLDLKRTAAQQADLDAYLAAAQQPGSGVYRKWLTPAQFASRFAPAPGQIEAARQWLTTQGFQVEAASPNGMRIAFSGSALQVNRAFRVTMRITSQTAEAAIAVDQAPTVPHALAETIARLSGLSSSAAVASSSRSALQDAIDNNTASVIAITSDTSSAGLAPLLEEAAAQGITVLLSGPQSAALAHATLLNTSAGGVTPADSSQSEAVNRPEWQYAPGLPANGLRAFPDATIASLNALTSGLIDLASRRGERFGELAPTLYRFSIGHGIFTHADSAAAPGTWSAADGLGTVNVTALLKVLSTGTSSGNLTLTPSSNTVTHGQALTLTLAATGAAGTPTGTVTATLRGRSNSAVTTLGPATLSSSGSATLTSNSLPGDIYDISGSYSGDTTYASAGSNATAVTVNPEPATITATIPAAAVAVGGIVPVTVTVTSASGIGAPSGAVMVNAYGTSVAAMPFTGNLAASSPSAASVTVSVPATDAGSFTFQASCASSASFSCSTPASAAVTVAKGVPVVTLTSTATASAVPNSATTPYNLVATVAAPAGGNSSATQPSGTVQVLDNGTPAASFTLTAGKGAYTLSLGGARHSLVAVYSGDANYVTANSTAAAITGNLIATTTTITTAVTTSPFGTPVPLTVSVTPASYAASGSPTGIITFTSSLQGVVGSARLGNGFVNFSPTTLIAGSHTITASYVSDNSDYASSATIGGVTFTITLVKVATTTTLTLSPNPPFANQLTTLTAAIAASGSTGAVVAPPFTGTVSFFANGVYLAQGSVTGNTTTVQVRLAPGAAISLTTSYNGDANFYGSTSQPVLASPVRVPSTITLSSNLSMPNAGGSVVLTATVTASNTAVTTPPTGTVTFFSTVNGVINTLGTATLAANGMNAATATFIASGLPGGLYSITATYSGDATFTPATTVNPVGIQFGDYSVSFNPVNVYLSRGSAASVTATLSVNNGFTGTVLFGCAPPASSNVTCTFNPASLNGGGQTVLTVTTSNTASNAIPTATPGRNSSTSTASATRTPTLLQTGIAAAGLLLLLSPSHRNRRCATLLLLLFSLATMSGGCSAGIVDNTNNTDSGSSNPVNGGGSSGSSGTGLTPYGTFLLNITTSTSDNSLRHTYGFPVTVQ